MIAELPPLPELAVERYAGRWWVMRDTYAVCGHRYWLGAMICAWHRNRRDRRAEP